MRESTKHIVILTPGFPANEEDSTTIPALQIYIKALKENKPNYDIKIITFQYPFTSQNYDWNGISVFPLNGKNKKYKKFFIWNKAKRLLGKIDQEKSIDIIHSFWLGECGFVGQNFTKNKQIIHVVTAMGQDVNKNLFLNLLLKSFVKNCIIITLSKKHKNILYENYGLNSAIIPWGINPNNFINSKEKSIDILGVGSLTLLKNFSQFINVISQLKTTIKNLTVEIIGEGNYKHQLKRKVKDYKLKDVIVFTGKLSRIDVLDKMKKSKILLHTSFYESFGLVFLEALNSQMKIVSFDVGFADHYENWAVCKTEKEMICSIINTFKNYTKPAKKSFNLIDETVLKYSNLYND